jgi:hypothetical protein
MRNSARGLALALQTMNPSLTVMMKDTENHWYQCVPLVEPDTDRLLARSSNLYPATRAHTMPCSVERTCMHCQIRYVERRTPCISMAEILHLALQHLPHEHVPT